MRTTEYFAPGFSSIEEVQEVHEIWDATALGKIADCPRKHEIRVERGLRHLGVSAKMVAGIAVHEGLDYYYAHADRSRLEDEAIEIMLSSWRSFDLDRATMNPNATHLTEDHLVKVLKNYFRCWNHERIEIFTPISGLTLDDLNLEDVLAAKFKLTPSGAVILGESSLIMKFNVSDDTLTLAGKPDLPVVKQDGTVYIMDHKTTSGYLSDYWAKAHEVSNKLRGYQAMIESLLGVQTGGAVINAIYVGKYATNPDSKATKFHRYTFDFTPDHVAEALQNQLALIKTIDFYRDLGYFPQTCGYGGCAHPDICRRDPATREEVLMTDYIHDPRSFWDI